MFKDDIIQGKIPWTAEGFQEVNTFLAQLLKTPKDDWSLTPSRYKTAISPFDPMGQVTKFLQEKYPQEHLWQAHLVRYNNIIRFFQDHQEALIQKNLLILKQPTPYIKDTLLKRLCQMPYGEQRERQGIVEHVFSLEDVLKG